MLNPEVLKCHEQKTSSYWRHKYNKEKQYIISFSYVKTLTSLAIWVPGGGGTSIIKLNPSWFTSTLSFTGHQGHRNVSKCSPHHNGDICTTRGNNLRTSFSYMNQNVKQMYILEYLGGPEGVFNDRTGPILLSSYPPTHIYVHVK